MNRRQVLQSLGAISSSLSLAQTQSPNPPASLVTNLARFARVWDDYSFNWMNQPCVMVRIPSSQPANPQALEVTTPNGPVFLIAFSRVCTHNGCTVQLPDGLRQMGCGCHGSLFDAASGRVLGGPAPFDLRTLKLEHRNGEIWASGFWPQR